MKQLKKTTQKKIVLFDLTLVCLIVVVVVVVVVDLTFDLIVVGLIFDSIVVEFVFVSSVSVRVAMLFVEISHQIAAVFVVLEIFVNLFHVRCVVEDQECKEQIAMECVPLDRKEANEEANHHRNDAK